MGLIGEGTTMWAARGFAWGPGSGPPPYLPFWTATENDGLNWSQWQTPLLSNGGPLAYEEGHHILYSSDQYAGFWRVVTDTGSSPDSGTSPTSDAAGSSVNSD
jgi:hypothetical protein